MGIVGVPLFSFGIKGGNSRHCHYQTTLFSRRVDESEIGQTKHKDKVSIVCVPAEISTVRITSRQNNCHPMQKEQLTNKRQQEPARPENKVPTANTTTR